MSRKCGGTAFICQQDALQGLVIRSGIIPKTESDASGQETLYGASVECGGNGWVGDRVSGLGKCSVGG